VRYIRTERARNDYARLRADEKDRLKEAVRLMNDAFNQRGDQQIPTWPKQLRIKSVQGAKGIWEMTWTWPDGRATFEYVDLGDEGLAILWRRIGGHEIFRDP